MAGPLSSFDLHAVREMRKLRRSLARKEEVEAAEGSGQLAALYGTFIEEIDRRLEQMGQSRDA